jgi:hypothetical protein
LVSGWQVPFGEFEEEIEFKVPKRTKGIVYAVLQ